MSDKLFWDPAGQKFVSHPESPSSTQEFNLDQLAEAMHAQQNRRMVWNKEVSRDYVYPLKVKFCNLMSAIEKYNSEIRQGWSINKEIKFDEELFRIAIEEYNNSVVRKYSRQ